MDLILKYKEYKDKYQKDLKFREEEYQKNLFNILDEYLSLLENLINDICDVIQKNEDLQMPTIYFFEGGHIIKTRELKLIDGVYKIPVSYKESGEFLDLISVCSHFYFYVDIYPEISKETKKEILSRFPFLKINSLGSGNGGVRYSMVLKSSDL